VQGFGLQEASVVTLFLTIVAVAYRAGQLSSRVDKLDESVRALHRRLDEIQRDITQFIAGTRIRA
jgi:hypothetical protein